MLGLQSSLSIPMLRSFRSVQDLSVDLLPHLVKILTPNVKPIVVGGSGDQRGIVSVRKEGERDMIQRAVEAMGAVGVTFERVRVESGQNGNASFAYRMEPLVSLCHIVKADILTVIIDHSMVWQYSKPRLRVAQPHQPDMRFVKHSTKSIGNT